ncbi:MAG: SpoIIE family protein phosphatase [Bryobacteraceae bacterium]
MRVLVGDDQQDVLEALRLLLKGAGHRAVTVDSPNALLAAARGKDFDLILMDLNYARDTTSGQEGLDLLASLQAQHNAAPIVVMTAWGSIDLAVEAMRRGAADFVQKPWDNARLLATLDKQVEQVRRSRTEMEIARNVQQKLFPRRSVAYRDIEYAGRCAPARDVSGDYYDFLDLGSGRMGIVLADVSGKGVPAALLMANLQACFRTQTENGPREPTVLLRSINHLFYESTSPENFATLFFGDYDCETHRLKYVNCGHLPPFVMRAQGGIDRLEPTATVLGAFPQWVCGDGETELTPGDWLFLYTDGVTEAESASGDDFGDARLEAVLKSARGDKPEGMIDKVIGAVQSFSHGAQEDDITVVALQRVA